MKKNLLLFSMCGLLLSIFYAKGQNTFCEAKFEYYTSYNPALSFPAVYLNLKDLSTGEISEWQWSVNDSIIGRTKTPPAYFARIDYNLKCKSTKCLPVYHVCLKIKTKDGCSSEFCKDIMMNYNPGCEAKFNYYVVPLDSFITPSMYIKGFYRPVRFSGISSSNVVKWEWDFGNGSYSYEQNPTHNYVIDPTTNRIDCMKKSSNCIPTFYVCLTVTTIDSCKAFYCDFVNPYENTSATCNASFIYDLLKSNPIQYGFHNKSNWDGGHVIWSFGDGNTSTEQNPIHIFDTTASTVTNKIYTVCLTINSSNGCVSRSCQDIRPTGNLCGNLIKLSTSFIAGSKDCSGYAKAELTDNSGNIVNAKSYQWSNGSTENEISDICPNQPFKVFITNEQGCITRGEFVISGTTEPVYILYQLDNSNYTLQYKNPVPEYTYTWKFCDGTIKTGSDVTYSSNQDCTATLAITDNLGTEISNQKIFLSKSTGKIDENVKEYVRLYPNPAYNVINLEFDLKVKSTVSIDILDINGKVWKQQKALHKTYFSINIEELPKGAYICRIQTGSNTVFRKFIK